MLSHSLCIRSLSFFLHVFAKRANGETVHSVLTDPETQVILNRVIEQQQREQQAQAGAAATQGDL